MICLRGRKPGDGCRVLGIVGNHLLEPENGRKPIPSRLRGQSLSIWPRSQAELAPLRRFVAKPKPNPILAGGCQTGAVGAEGHRLDPTGMSPEHADLAPVPEPHGVVMTDRGQPPPIGTKRKV